MSVMMFSVGKFKKNFKKLLFFTFLHFFQLLLF